MKSSYIYRYVIIAITIMTYMVNPNASYAETIYPNFTNVVEKNIPAVVIVHAKKDISSNPTMSPNIPNLPDEFKPFFDKFFDEEQNKPPESRKAPSFGSGFILTSDGYIMTNNHVIANSDEIIVTMSDQNEYEAKLIGSDVRSDLALLKVDANNLPVVKIGTSEDLKLGETVKVDHFIEGEFVDVSGISKGKGFQGVVKRHGFAGVGQATHGQHNRLRAPGSIGAASYPARVFKGMKMAGQTGNKKVKIQNLKVLKVIPEKNLIVIKGAVPGHKNSYVIVRK